MRKASLAILTIAATAIGGCSMFGGRSSPDEFAVARNAPLVIPPDYGLQPPVAGTAGITAQDAQTQAVEVLFGGPSARSQSESSMLDAAGRERAPVGVRSTVGDPDTRITDKGAATMTILNAPEGDSQVASAQVPQ